MVKWGDAMLGAGIAVISVFDAVPLDEFIFVPLGVSILLGALGYEKEAKIAKVRIPKL